MRLKIMTVLICLTISNSVFGQKIGDLPTSAFVDSNTFLVGQEFTGSSFSNGLKVPLWQLISFIGGGGTIVTNITAAYGAICTPSTITGMGRVGVDTTKISTLAQTRRIADSAAQSAGTVTSVGIVGSATISIGGTSPITSAGTFTVSIPASVPLSGSPTTTTQSANDNSTKIATTAYVDRTGAQYTNSTTATTITPTSTIADARSLVMVSISAQATSLTINAPTGSWAIGQILLFNIQDNGTPQSLTWNAAYQAGSTTNNGVLPISTLGAGHALYQFMYAGSSKFYFTGYATGY